MIRYVLLALAPLALPAAPAAAKTIAVAAGADAQERLQTALIDAKPGDVIRLGVGTFTLTDGLSLDVDGVTVRGAGKDRSTLDFKGQLGAGEGLLVTSDDVSCATSRSPTPRATGSSPRAPTASSTRT